MERDASTYRLALRAIYERPWALAEDALHELAASLALISLGQIDRAQFEQTVARTNPARASARSASVAVVPIHGVITQGQGLLSFLLGGSTVDQISGEFRAAITDKTIDAVALDVNSPGGTVDGIEELASLIRSQRGKKPIVAIANGAAQSAAYWLASAADEITVTPSGRLGAIGVWTIHQDVSGADALEGIKTTVLSYGKHKTEGNQWEPLSDEARGQIQGRLDYLGQMFERAVARGRSVPVERVRNDFGQGRSFNPDQAVRLGMADRQETFDDTLQRIASGVLTPQQAAASSVLSPGLRSETPADDSADLREQTEPQAADATQRWKRVRTALAIAELTT